MAANGEVISRRDGRLVVPDRPVVPFIEGDGTGPDIWRASVRVFDEAVRRAYGGATVVWARTPSAPCGGSACPGLGGGSFRGIWWVPTSYCP